MTSMDPWRPDPTATYAPPRGGAKPLVPPIAVRVIFVPWRETDDESKEWRSKSQQWNAVKTSKKFQIVYWDQNETAHPILRLASSLSTSTIYIRGHGSPGAPSIVTKVKDLDIPLAIEDACDRLIGMGLSAGFAGAVKFHFCYSGTVFPTVLLGEKRAKALRGIAQTDTVLHGLQQAETAADQIVTAQTAKLAGMGRLGKAVFGAKEEAKKTTAEQARADAQGQLVAGRDFRHKQELKVPTNESLAAKGARHMRGLGFTSCRYYGYLGPVESEYGAMDTSSTNPDDWHKYVNVEALHEAPGPVQAHLAHGGNPSRVRASVARVQIP